METFPEFVKEVFKGIVRATSAFLFNKTFFRTKENHPKPSEAKGWSSK